MLKRPAFWILLALVSILGTAAAVHYFPQAFSIVALDITMTRERALEDAAAIAARGQFGPAGYRQAASFALDGEAQTFIELEGGGKETFTRMMRDGLYSAYTWRVRHFREGETNETTFRFTPDGKAYGFVEKIKEDAPGAALAAGAARAIGEEQARAGWNVDLTPFTLVEQGQERRPGGRVDHTLTYERSQPVLGEGRYRLRLVVSGDRLTEVTHLVKIPEAFTRRYDSMRSANEAIGIGSVVGMVLLYVVGGIGVGLFFMLRGRYVLWRQAAIWGFSIGALQTLAAVNEFPLIWMNYDTAVPRSTFLAGQAASLLATLLGFSAFLALSFVAAETLGRKAFGQHPQLWRVWTKGPGSSTAVLGRTVAGYLLVSVFFAYDVALYVIATRYLGWWTPSEALLHPDVLATYVPWLSAIANSLQAGFWEECLFRAVPLAGAALIGDRFGKRNLFLAVAFVVQAVIFGAGHAPYPTQPSFARPVELIIPSIGFGLLYVYFGLLPGIVLHFAFDVVWFALPIFLSDTPGIWLQKLMVVVMTFVPLWVVLYRRWQSGAWTLLPADERNAAWTPPAAAEPEPAPVEAAPTALPASARTAWIAIGAVSLAACVWAIAARDHPPMFSVSRARAAAIARETLAARGVALGPQWRVLPIVDDGSGGPREFVATVAGDERRKELVGKYLPDARWRVRVATFEGDVAERAEEWRVFVTRSGDVLRVEHTLPEGRAGATLDENRRESARRRRAEARVRPGCRQRSGPRSVGAASQAEGADGLDLYVRRRDGTAVATGRTAPRRRDRRRSGRRRATVRLRSGAVGTAATGDRDQEPDSAHRRRRRLWRAARRGGRRRRRRMEPPALHTTPVFCGRGNHARGDGRGGWKCVAGDAGRHAHRDSSRAATSRRPRRGAGRADRDVEPDRPGAGCPASTGCSGRALAERDAIILGCAVGAFAAALQILASAVRTPAWAESTWIGPAGTFVPMIAVAVEPISGLLTRTAVMLSLLTGVHHITLGWTRRRAAGAAIVLLVGFLGAGAPAGAAFGGWIAAGIALAIGLARRLYDAASCRPDHGPDYARDDDRRRRHRARRAAAVSRRAARSQQSPRWSPLPSRGGCSVPCDADEPPRSRRPRCYSGNGKRRRRVGDSVCRLAVLRVDRHQLGMRVDVPLDESHGFRHCGCLTAAIDTFASTRLFWLCGVESTLS